MRGEASDQVVESGVGGAAKPRAGPGPKSKLKPVSTGFGRGRSNVSTTGLGRGRSNASTTGLGRGRSNASRVGAGLGWVRSRRQFGFRSWGVSVRDGGELWEL